ncbi:MAG: hypothetical protein H6623_09670 [Bdellovibrionaceae bacterium]|nr:hypothetical protein [Pseudobdellovibrionaceae bacterium]
MNQQKFFFIVALSAMLATFYALGVKAGKRIPASIETTGSPVYVLQQANPVVNQPYYGSPIPQTYSVDDLNQAYALAINNDAQLRQQHLMVLGLLQQAQQQKQMALQRNYRLVAYPTNRFDQEIRRLQDVELNIRNTRDNNLSSGYMRFLMTYLQIQNGLTQEQHTLIRRKLEYLTQLRTAARMEGNSLYAYPTSTQPWLTANVGLSQIYGVNPLVTPYSSSGTSYTIPTAVPPVVQ